ncbi:hypothetical protein OKA04_04700 [Luteolibacter flavescens]|uniref:Uncharacterized protein n=1 Tax=Luteolibacter flavescens TaxID=1859460 RepID=A0ABT3FL99_9BACT|nr:hypothetical protein [Luteolibacter flavescens]MCW1884016.1 hypothetical protein [Luteolibacter flavescens]
MTTTLYDLRAAIRDVLVNAGLFTAKQVIISRRADIWNAVNTAVSAAEHGRCAVIDTPTADPQRNNENSKVALMEVTIAVNIIERTPTRPEETDEASDVAWQRMVVLLQGNLLGRSGDHANGLRFDGVAMVPNQPLPVRQTIFKTRLLVCAQSTPQIPPPTDP